MNSKYTLLVNSCDSFSDCWDPFFILLKKKWENNNFPILLNTEFKTYKHEGLNIKTSRSHQMTNERRLTWSECLIQALEMVETPLVLYMQEDYFIEKQVKSDLIDDFAKLMTKDHSIKHIGLTDFGSKPPFQNYNNDERLWIISQKSNYRISTQAGLWDRAALLSYLKAEENGWMFEIYGTRRAQKKKDLFLTANREMYNLEKNSIISYTHTGIIKGKWHVKIPNLFKKNGIVVDFKIRGFYKEKQFFFRKIETLLKLLQSPLKFIKGMLGQ